MTEERTSETSEPIEGETPAVGTQERTVEQVEAEYRARQAGKDREAQALRDQLARYQAAETERTAAENARRTAELGEVEALKQQLEQERTGRVLDTRAARYPFAAETLSTEALLAMDDAKLTALESRLAPTGARPPQRVDPNTPPRPSTNVPPAEKSIEDLKADLKNLTPEFISSLRG
jgi:hypothetical protein